MSGSLYLNGGYDVVPGGVGLHIDAYESLTASLTYYGKDDRYYVRAWGENLTDNNRPIYLQSNSNGFLKALTRPVSYGVTVGFKIGG